MYPYVNNRPLDATDPSGMTPYRCGNAGVGGEGEQEYDEECFIDCFNSPVTDEEHADLEVCQHEKTVEAVDDCKWNGAYGTYYGGYEVLEQKYDACVIEWWDIDIGHCDWILEEMADVMEQMNIFEEICYGLWDDIYFQTWAYEECKREMCRDKCPKDEEPRPLDLPPGS
jgi:hypothetical protein